MSGRTATEFLAAHPGIVRTVDASAAFRGRLQRAAIDIDGERLYVVRGDTLGSVDELIVETLVRGARSSDPGDPDRQLFEGLDPGGREAIRQRIREAPSI